MPHQYFNVLYRTFLENTWGSCYVYIDDIIIFSKDKKPHAQHILQILKLLRDADMKVQMNECEFLKKNKKTECLGFIVSLNGINTNPT